MSENDIRYCKACGKQLIDEKLPFCSRCVLEGRDKAGKGVAAVGGMIITGLGIYGLVKGDGTDAQV